MTDPLPIQRLSDVRKFRKKRPDDTVWSCCRYCNADIPQSAPEHAYCDMECKKDMMADEMGFAPS